jgi:RHS repeat-associated protein
VIYYHTDAIGSVRMTTDATGAVIARYDYLPFGEIWPTNPPNANPDVRQFTAKERDVETGLDYFGARYYRPQSGWFTSVDPVLNVEAALTDPQRWNRYAYARNNSIAFVHPDGRDLYMVHRFNKEFMQWSASIRDRVASVMGAGAPGDTGTELVLF